MKSYAVVDRFEGEFAVCEVEVLTIEESYVEDFFSKPTVMMDIPITEIYNSIGDFQEGDILIIEHNCERVITIYSKDEEEKSRRIELLKQMIG